MTERGWRIAATGALASMLMAALPLVGWTAPAAAVPPPAPSPAAPAAGASVTIPFTISWAEVAGAGGYHWQLSRTSTFDEVIERNDRLLAGAATTDGTISGIPPGTWFWRVQAVSRDLEAGPWSAPRSVVVTGAGSGVPATPTLHPPRDATTFRPWEIITMSWDPVPGAVSYVLQESTDPDFPVGTRSRQLGLPGPTERITFNPGSQGSFQARVLAVGPDGLLSTPSDTVSFSVSDTNPLPAAPTLVAPASGTTRALPVTLSWNHVPNHQDDGYQVQVSGSSSFSTVERTFRTSDDHLVVQTLTPGTKFWRVRSQHGYIGAVEAYTAWSATRSFTVPAGPLAVSTVTFPSPKFSGGEARGAIHLTGPAPSGGATVELSTSHPALLPELPASRVVPAGSTSVDVLVAPTGFPNSIRGMRVGFVSEPTTVTVTASYAGTAASTAITLLPPRLNDTPLQIFPMKATGGADMLGIVDLEIGCFAGICDGLAPPGGFPLTLSSSSPAASVPATFTIPAGAGGASFPITTRPVERRTHVTITARAGAATASWTLDLTPSPEPDRLALVPQTTASGSQGQVFVPLSEMQGHDQLVRVTSSNPSVASVPEFATVNASTELGRFDITTSPVAEPTQVTISVTGRGVTRSATLTVAPSVPALTSLSVSPTSVAAGTPATGTVTLGSPAPAGGVSVSLGSNLPGSGSVPPAVTVPGGATSASFPVTTSAGSGTTTVQLSASLGDTTRFAALTVTAGSSTPAAPTLASPANGATGVSQPVTLDWGDVAGATSYEVRVDDSSTMSSPYVANPTVTSSQATLSGLPTRQLWWQVRARNASGVFGPFSATRSFTPQTTSAPPPGGSTLAAPSLLSPAHNAELPRGRSITFDWSDVPGAARYTIVIDDGSSFSSPNVNTTVSASTFSTSSLPRGRFYWRVRAVDGSGTPGTWSASRRFEVD